MKKIWLMLIAASSCFHALSQDSVKHGNKWHYLVEVYLMFPNMSGTAGLGSLPDVSVDANPGDIFSHLQMGAMLYVEASNARWSVNSDLTYMSLKQDVKTGILINNGQATAKQLAWELAGLYRIHPLVDVGIGAMLNSIQAGVNINVNNIGGGITNRSKEFSKTWVDPMLIVRLKSRDEEKLIYLLRAEIGGFGIGSSLTWQVQAYAGYQFSKLFQLTGGYRVIGINYNKGTGEDRFLYNMTTFGPVIRFGFNF